MAKIASKQAASTQRGKPTVDFSLNYNRSVEPEMAPETVTEMASWIDDLLELGLARNIDPAKDRLTAHLPMYRRKDDD